MMKKTDKIKLLKLLQEKDNRQFEINCKDPYWRLNNLYYIKDGKGNKIILKFNKSQNKFYKEMHYLNLILKARQLGFTTLIQMILLDACIFNDNVNAGVIAQTKGDSEEFFDQKIKFAWDNIDPRIKDKITEDSNSARTLKFSNGSKIIVGTSLRSGTFQYLHISEYGKICAKFPNKAIEIRTGALNTVANSQYIFIESTAEGQGGHFYGMVDQSRKAALENKKLTDMDYKFHFFPWYEDTNYILEENIIFSKNLVNYYNDLETKGIQLSTQQRNWYCKKKITQLEEMKREYPSTPDEAFEAAIDGSIFVRSMDIIRKNNQICNIPIDIGLPVNTWWDLGISDSMTIWFHQFINGEHRFINYYENSGEGIQHYVTYLQNFQTNYGFTWGEHYGPHDLSVRELSRNGKTRKESFLKLGIDFKIIPRTNSKQDSIQNGRTIIPQCWFDETRCAQGITYLDQYTKEWDDRLGVWKDKPRHDMASHCADAFLCFADGWGINNKIVKIEDYTFSSEW